MGTMKQLTEKEAIAFFESKVWETWNERQISEFQIEQDRLCVPFDVFHEALEKALKRPVFTHEFGCNLEGLKRELYGEKEPPTLEDILSWIPKEKLMVVWQK